MFGRRAKDPQKPSEWFGAEPGFARFLIDPVDWIHRRVESIIFVNDTTMRRKCSIDFTVHRALPILIANRSTRLVPLGHFTKRDLVRLDVSDESGRAIPILTTDQNSELSFNILREIVTALDPELNYKFDDKWIRGIVELPEERALKMLDERMDKAAIAETHNVDEDITLALYSLLKFFACKFLLVAVVNAEHGERRIVKFAYDTPIDKSRRESWREKTLIWLGWKDRSFSFDTPSASECQSFHLELSCPDGLTFRTWGVKSEIIQDDKRINIMENINAATEKAHIVHLHYPNPRENSIAAGASIGLSKNGWLRRSMIVSTIILLVMVVAAWRGPVVFPKRNFSAAVLMALVAVAAGQLVRDNDHPIRARMLMGPTILTFLTVAIPAIGAMILVFGYDHTDQWIWWLLVTITSIFWVAIHIAFWRR